MFKIAQVVDGKRFPRPFCYSKSEHAETELKLLEKQYPKSLFCIVLCDHASHGQETGSAKIGHPWPPRCDRCLKELKRPGALIFSPPNQHGECTKSHICVECHGGLVVWVSDGKVQVES